MLLTKKLVSRHRGIARFLRIDPKCNQVVPWSVNTFPENFMQIGPAVLPEYKTSQTTDRQTDRQTDDMQLSALPSTNDSAQFNSEY